MMSVAYSLFCQRRETPLIELHIDGQCRVTDDEGAVVRCFADSVLARTGRDQLLNDYERVHAAEIREADAMLWATLSQVRERRS